MILPPDVLIEWYRTGLFPMADAWDGRIGLFSPDPRGIIDLAGWKAPRSLASVVRSGRFTIRIDAAFERVMRQCADRSETWISEDIIASYCTLHRAGFAHSVEAWRGDELAGGLYGVALGGAFFGESMFHRERDASKVALAALIARLRDRGFVLLDTQYSTPHLESLGAVEISRDEYLERLGEALAVDATFFP